MSAPTTAQVPQQPGSPDVNIADLASQLQAGGKSQSPFASTSQASQLAQTQGSGSNNQPRAVGTLGEELIKRPLQDIAKGLKSIFSVSELLGVENVGLTPEQKAKQKSTLQKFNSLTEAEQNEVRKRQQADMERKQRMMEEDEMRRRREAQSKQAVVMPSSPQRGAPKPGKSGKQNAMQQLQDDRTKIGKVQGAF